MKIDFFDIDQFCENLSEVTSNKIYSKKGFHPDGLFSERIFGPVKTCTCGCGQYWGRSKLGQVCSICNVKIAFSSIRRKSFAKIKLPFPIINPMMYYLIAKIGKITISKILDNMIFDDTILGFYFNEETKKYVKVLKSTIENETPELPEGITLYSGIDGMFELIKFESERFKDTNKNWNYINENLSKFFMSHVIVSPPEFRPVSKTKDVQMRDQLNEFFLTILNFSLMMKDDLTSDQNENIRLNNFKDLQRHIFNLYEYIFSKFSKKTGLIRGSILGKRVDFSARAVITPDPTLNLDECKIPYQMGLELFKLDVVNKLLELKNFDTHTFIRYDSALKYIDKCIQLHNYILLDIVKEVCADRYIILNRQPTLHRMGFLSFKIKINTEDVIQIHPMICEPYNADFDGDQMAVYVSLYPKTEEENYKKFSILNNIISPSTGNCLLGVNQDILLGLYLLTKPIVGEEIEYQGHKTYKGRISFNSILPKGCPFINRTITKKELRALLNIIVKSFDKEIVMDLMDKIKTYGLNETTKKGVTISLNDLSISNVYDTVSSILDDDTKGIKEKFFNLQNDPRREQALQNFPYRDFIDSGSRGSWDQVTQLIFARGFISNSQGEVIPTPIKNNLINGLTREEFFISCYGSRKALLDVALNTAVSGYLTRKLVYCAVNLELNSTLDDCGTTDTFKLKIPEYLTHADIERKIVHITNEKEKTEKRNLIKHDIELLDPVKLTKSLIGRWVVEKENNVDILKQITIDNYMSFCGKEIQLRSPIFCKSPKICKICYGGTHQFIHSNYIGVIAAQALGEIATQLTLRTFHIGGVAKMNTQQEDDQQQDIINDLSLVNKLFHGHDGSDYNYIITKLFSIYSRHKVLLLVHFESVVSQMMRVEDMRWRLVPDRNKTQYNISSIENVPSKESFLLGLAFSKPHNFIVSGILNAATDVANDGILEKMLTNQI